MARYTLRQLEAFVAVAEQGSIAAAAESLHVSQSAVSGAVNNLERVFDRSEERRVGKECPV